MHYVREFDAKWLHGGMHSKEPLIGSADIQSLADLGNSTTPITQQVVLRFVAATLLPIVPLLLTMMSPEALLKKLVGILF